MGKSKVRTLLTACMIVMLCTTMIIAGTYALWTDNVTVSNHLSAGTLKVKLVRTDLRQWKLDDRGIVSEADIAEADKKADFTKDTTKNVFGLEETELVAPTSKYSATMLIANNGGNVAFDYNVYLKLDSAANVTDEELAGQIKITVTKKDGTKVNKLLSECGDNHLIASGRVLVNAANAEDTFTVTIEFINYATPTDGKNNDDAQGKKAKFDLFVEAVQATEI